MLDGKRGSKGGMKNSARVPLLPPQIDDHHHNMSGMLGTTMQPAANHMMGTSMAPPMGMHSGYAPPPPSQHSGILATSMGAPTAGGEAAGGLLSTRGAPPTSAAGGAGGVATSEPMFDPGTGAPMNDAARRIALARRQKPQ